MQYRTITVEHSMALRPNGKAALNEEYQNILNEQAAQGWKLLGIHSIEVRRKIGCVGRIWNWWLMIWGESMVNEFYQDDILVFFKE